MHNSYDDQEQGFSSLSGAELDYINDCNHEIVVERRYGPDVIHISNFGNEDKQRVQTTRDQLQTAFVGVAFAGNVPKVNPSMVGVYTRSVEDIKKFWDIHYWRNLDKPGRL